MNEDQLRELFKATNTAEPLSEGWPGLLRYGLAVAAAEREACAKVCETVREQDARGGNDSYLEGRQMGATVCMNTIRMRSNVKLRGGITMGNGMKAFDEWWDADQLTQTNPYREDSPAYWAWEGWQASTTHSASKLNLSRAEVSLMAGDLSASEWRTIAAVLKGLQARIRNNE